MTIHDIKAANRRAGKHWFDSNNMRFFRSRILPTVYPSARGAYFITSEQYDDNSPRLYTVREAIDGGRDIDTIGEFQAYRTKAEAVAAIHNLLMGRSLGSLGASGPGQRTSPIVALSLVGLALLAGWGMRR